MERGQFKKYHGQGSRFMGAILMSNRKTKQECIERKLFGLPSSMSWFMKRIKAGMLLFLFEHEERKLYGVFEAASDGAMNIMPNAFISTGNSFPAQILFRRVWMCKPLFESEFCDAIRENYFARDKFNFGLSYEQVVKLIHLFSLKRINVKQHSRPGIPNEIIKQFEKYDRGRVVSHRNWELECVSHENVTYDGTYSRRYLGGPGPKTNNSMSQVKLTKKQFSDKFGNGLEQMDPDSTNPHPPYLLGYESSLPENKVSTSNNLSVCRNSSELLVNPHSSLDFRGQNLTGTLSMVYRTHPEEPIKYPPPKSVVLSSLISDPSSVSLSLLTSESHPNFCDHNRYESQDECYDPLNPMISFSPGSNVARRTEALGSVHSSGSRHETSRHEFDSTGQPCEDSGRPSDYIPIPETDCIDRNVDSFNLNSVQNDMPGNCSSDSEENFDFEGLRPFVATPAEEYYPPAAVSSRLHSDIEQNRTSVFFRLAKTTDQRQNEGLQKPISSLSLDQLVGILSQRRNQLNEMTKAPKPSIVQDDNVEKRQSNVCVEISNVPYPDKVELSDDDIFADDAIAEENSDELFLNFKRRSDIRKLSTKREMDTRSETETGPVEEILHKRRKLVRPSFSEEECRNVQFSSHEIVGDNINSSAADNSPCDAAITDENVKRSEGSRNSLLSSDKKSSSASEASLREESSESLRTRRKEISNRNLQWFLRKSIDNHVKSSNGGYVIDKQKSASQMAGGVVLLPAHSKCKDQETDCFSEVNLTSLIDEKPSHD